MVGTGYTIADFSMLASYGPSIIHPARKDAVLPILEKYPVLKAYYEGKWEAQKEYLESRGESSF